MGLYRAYKIWRDITPIVENQMEKNMQNGWKLG